MYMYKNIQIHVCICIYVHIYTYIYLYIYMYTYTCMYVHTYAYVHKHVYIYIYIYIYTLVCAYILASLTLQKTYSTRLLLLFLALFIITDGAETNGRQKMGGKIFWARSNHLRPFFKSCSYLYIGS